MAAVRTLVVTVSPLLVDLVVGVLQPLVALDIIEVLHSRNGLEDRLRAVAPDLVVLGLVGCETDSCVLPLLAVAPLARILVLAPDGRHGWLHELHGDRVALPDMSVAGLADAMVSRFGPVPSRG